MKIEAIPFAGLTAPKDAVDITQKISLGWSAPIKLPLPVRINGVFCQYVNLSNYGAIRFAEAKDGRYHFMGGDSQIPIDMSKIVDGYLLIPWGELQKFTCGCHVKMWQTGGKVSISFETKSEYGLGLFIYRVEFSGADIIEVHYYHCTTGYETIIGAALAPGQTAVWPEKEHFPYMKKALRFYFENGIPVDTTPAPEQKPMGPVTDNSPTTEPPLSSPADAVWETKYLGSNYRVQELIE